MALSGYVATCDRFWAQKDTDNKTKKTTTMDHGEKNSDSHIALQEPVAVFQLQAGNSNSQFPVPIHLAWTGPLEGTPRGLLWQRGGWLPWHRCADASRDLWWCWKGPWGQWCFAEFHDAMLERFELESKNWEDSETSRGRWFWIQGPQEVALKRYQPLLTYPK